MGIFLDFGGMMMRKLILILVFTAFIPSVLISQIETPAIKAYFYPHLINGQDTLLDGPEGKKIHLNKNTALIWVDLAPDLFFSHKTLYILISQEKIRIKNGKWWPVLNGKKILYGEEGQYALTSPYNIPAMAVTAGPPTGITMYVYPHELNAQDMLTDGPIEKLFLLDDNCLLVWVDLLPGAFFVHPTAYIFISRKNTHVESGSWWPTLNGRRILYGQKNKIGILSPFCIFY